jgi:transposase-like protein
MFFCPYCTQPEVDRREGNPGASARFVTFACGSLVEARGYDGYSGQAGSLLLSQRAITCIAFGNSHPQRLQARIVALEAQLKAQVEAPPG